MNAPFPHSDQPALADAAASEGCVATVAIVVPVHNEEAAIAPFLNAVRLNTDVLTGEGIAFEFIFVNDGSTDATLERLIEAQREDPRIRIIDLSRKFGKEAAMTAGLDACGVDAAIPICGIRRM